MCRARGRYSGPETGLDLTHGGSAFSELVVSQLRFEQLPVAVIGVLRQFARVSGLPKVAAAAAYPVNFSEPPVYSRVYVLDKRAEDSKDTADANIENAVVEATELLHEDTAYEFEMKWQLWEYEAGEGGLDGIWRRVPKTVKVLAFGPEFDDQTFEHNGLNPGGLWAGFKLGLR